MTAALCSPTRHHPLESSPVRQLWVAAALALALVLHTGDARAALAPCKIVDADARVGIVATLMLAEHLAGRAGSPGASKGTRAKAKQTLISTLELTRGLTSKVLSTQSAKIDKKAAAALGTLKGDLSAIIGETGSTAIIGEAGAKALQSRLAGLRQRAASVVGNSTAHFESKALAAVAGLVFVNGLVMPPILIPAEQVVSVAWLMGPGGIVTKLGSAAAPIPKTKASLGKLTQAAADYHLASEKGSASASSLADIELAQQSVAKILIGL
jgi:hypothetical protein